MLNVTELQSKSTRELHEVLREKREEFRKLKFSASENQLKEVRTIREVRRDIARILTAINSYGTPTTK